MAYNGTDLGIDPLYLQTKSYDARSDRKWFSDIATPGVLSAPTTTTGDYAVTYSGSVLTLNVAAGIAWILGSNIADQGTYREYSSSAVQVTCPAADLTNPRIDTVILRVFDNAADASGLNKARVDVVPGTPTAGATLANLNGKNALTSLTDVSLSFIVLAYILVPAGATTLTNTATNVKDARSVMGIKGATEVSARMFVTGGGTQSIPDSAFTTLNGMTQDYANGGISTASGGLFTVPVAGRYLITAILTLNNAPTTAYWLPQKNGSGLNAEYQAAALGNAGVANPYTGIINCAANDILGMRYYQVSGTARTVQSAQIAVQLLH